MPRPPRSPSHRSVGLTLAVALAALFAWMTWTRAGGAWVPLAAGTLLAALALVRPALLAPVSRAWLGLGELLHRIVSPVVIGVIFFGVITPYALVMRLAGRDALRLRGAKDASTFWLPRDEPSPPADSYRQQF